MKKDPILEIIEKSGNGFHLKVDAHLRSLGWETCVSQFYSDPVTGKPREIDILAKKKYPIGDSGEHLTVRLFIECKYVSDDNVLWFVARDKEKTKAIIKDNLIFRDTEEYQLTIMNGLEVKKHHYLKNDKVAKLSAKAGNSDIFYDGMNGCLHSLISLENESYDPNRLDYPVMVLNSFDKVHEVTGDPDDPHQNIKTNFQLAADYSYPNKNGSSVNQYFLIDIVDFSLLDSFLKEMEETDITLAKERQLSEIRQRIWNDRYERNNDNDYDPYYPI